MLYLYIFCNLTDYSQQPNRKKHLLRYMLHTVKDFCYKPMDTKQIKNKKYYEKKKDQGSNEGYHRNVADNVIRVENMVHTHPFVQSVIHTKDKVPSVICYTPEQLLDIQRFCIKGNCVLGFDKTFNLGGDVHVTPSVFKNMSVNRGKTGEPPIFLGPVLLHGNCPCIKYLFSWCL